MHSYTMDSTIAALKDLESVMPGMDKHTRDLAAARAQRLNPSLNAMGVVLSVKFLFMDLVNGKSGFASLPLPSSLVGLPVQVYAAWNLLIPKIIRAAAPAELADEFDALWAAHG